MFPLGEVIESHSSGERIFFGPQVNYNDHLLESEPCDNSIALCLCLLQSEEEIEIATPVGSPKRKRLV